MAKKKAAAKAKAKAKVAKAAPEKPAIVNIKPAPPDPVAEKRARTDKYVKESLHHLHEDIDSLNAKVNALEAWKKQVDADIQWLKDRSRP